MQFTASNTLNFYQFPSHFGEGQVTATVLPGITVATFHEVGGGTCVPQWGTSQQLDSLASCAAGRRSALGEVRYTDID